MGIEDTTTRMMIVSSLNNGLMTYHSFDALGRMVWMIEAPIEAENGTPSLKTEYKFDGTTSRIVASKETVVEWDEVYSFDNIDELNLP